MAKKKKRKAGAFFIPRRRKKAKRFQLRAHTNPVGRCYHRRNLILPEDLAERVSNWRASVRSKLMER